MKALLSKKLVLAVAAMAFATGLILGLAYIRPESLTENKELVALVLTGDFTLGGWGIGKQAAVDIAANGGG